MAELSYRQAGLMLRVGSGSEQQVRDLQRDLRQLGYLASRLDGVFGRSTAAAVRALQQDLLSNSGESTDTDGRAPVRVMDYNHGRVREVSGRADQGLVECVSDMLDDRAFSKLPSAQDPAAENARVVAQIAALPPTTVPIPFLLAVLKQESGLKHFYEPSGNNQDNYIVVGPDRNSEQRHVITSRGYGVGQYTLFHHPPTTSEVNAFMLDPAGNVIKANAVLREKFDRFVNGPTKTTKARDRLAEFGTGPLRPCKYRVNDSRHMRDCHACAAATGSRNINAKTLLFPGSEACYQPTSYYRECEYADVPARAGVGCDWPYAVRRYNGSGMNSYHYQVRVLQHLRGMERG